MTQKMAEISPEDIRLCSVVKSELYYGSYKSTRRDRNLPLLNRFFSQFVSIPFDDNNDDLRNLQARTNPTRNNHSDSAPIAYQLTVRYAIANTPYYYKRLKLLILSQIISKLHFR